MSSTTTTTFSEVVSPCETCSHANLCKYQARCTRQLSIINTKIGELNDILNNEATEVDVSFGDLFTLGFATPATVPNLVLSCELYAQAPEEQE